MMALLRLSYLL